MFQISVFEETVNKKNLSIIFYSLRQKRWNESKQKRNYGGGGGVLPLQLSRYNPTGKACYAG